MGAYAHGCRCLRRSEEVVRAPGAGDNRCELRTIQALVSVFSQAVWVTCLLGITEK